MYLLLTGLPPFRGTGKQLSFNKCTGNIEYDMIVPSRSARDLVKLMLTVDPDRRLNIEQVFQHEWINQDDEELAQNDLSLARVLFRDWEKTPRNLTTLSSRSDSVRFEI
jgi:doublecortin-like kinase 1/2